jgi:transketolase
MRKRADSLDDGISLKIKRLHSMAGVLRRDSLTMTTKAKSGHPTSCLSCAEIMSTLFFDEMKYDVGNAENLDNDEFIMSKGHAAPILYSCLYHNGCARYDLLGLRKFNSPLEGHPTPFTKWIKFATGSLGQGLSLGAGMALGIKLQKRKSKVYVLLGDSEMAEGSNWEAIQIASYYGLNNLIAIVDINRLGQRGETMVGHDISKYKKRFEAFGWEAIQIDGHNVKQILSAFEKAKKSEKPVAILAKTMKGKGIRFIEDKEGWHGKVLDEKELEKALRVLDVKEIPAFAIRKPETTETKPGRQLVLKPLVFKPKEEMSTREAYGKALANLARINPDIIALDAEVSNSTFAEEVKKIKPKQFVECFIAEQNMIGMALGLSKKGFSVYASTFAAFLERAYDQIRMTALSKPNMTLIGSHCGCSIGEDGPSQMGLEDIALFRALPGTIILYPSDAISAEKLTYTASQTPGFKYIRTTRPKTPIIHGKDEKFPIGDFKVLRQSVKDRVVLIGAGITLHESLKAHEELKKEKIDSAVVDLYCIKPLDIKKLSQFIKSHGSKLIIAEDHYKEGGIGEMLMSSLPADISIRHLCVREVPHSGSKTELLERYGLSASAIVKEAKKVS